jgi:Domain of unknown function DUF11
VPNQHENARGIQELRQLRHSTGSIVDRIFYDRFQVLPKQTSMRFLTALVLMLLAGSLPAQVVLLSDVSVNVTASPNTNLVPGEPIVFTVTVTNNGPTTLTNFAVVSANEYPDQIDITAIASDCVDIHLAVVDAATTFWYYEAWYPTDTDHSMIGNWPLAAGESRSCHVTLALAPSAPQILPFDLHLDTFWSDPNPTNDVGRVVLQRAIPTIPTLSPAMLTLLMLLLMGGQRVFAHSRKRG